MDITTYGLIGIAVGGIGLGIIIGFFSCIKLIKGCDPLKLECKIQSLKKKLREEIKIERERIDKIEK